MFVQVIDDGKCAKHGDTVKPICYNCYAEQVTKARQDALEEAAKIAKAEFWKHRKERGVDIPELLQVWDDILALAKPRNQCDGCQDGRPVDARGNHTMGDGAYSDKMACQKDKYNSDARKKHDDAVAAELSAHPPLPCCLECAQAIGEVNWYTYDEDCLHCKHWDAFVAWDKKRTGQE